MTKHHLPAATRFWRYVQKTDSCWLWTGAKSYAGYGRFQASEAGEPRFIDQAHRFSWTTANGTIPGRLWVLHRCDVPACVRPDHLFLGTRQDNVDDMVAKGRGKTCRFGGADHPGAKLTPADVERIRQRRLAGELLRVIAKDYGLGTSQVWRIIKGLSWPVLVAQ